MEIAPTYVPAVRTYKYTFLLIRNALLPIIVFAATALLSGDVMLGIMIALGQAHFLMAYWYQFRAKKMSRGYLALALLIGVATGVYFVFSGAFLPLYFLGSIAFALHFVIDELTLHDERWNYHTLTTATVFLAMFSALIVHVIFPIPNVVFWVIAAAVLLPLIRIIFFKHTIRFAEWYLWFIELCFLGIVFIIAPFSQVALPIFIILLHVCNWTIGYGYRLHGKAQEKKYWIETALITAVCAVGYILYWFNVVPLLGFLFAIGPYYAWAFLHIGLSLYLARPQWG